MNEKDVLDPGTPDGTSTIEVILASSSGVPHHRSPLLFYGGTRADVLQCRAVRVHTGWLSPAPSLQDLTDRSKSQ